MTHAQRSPTKACPVVFRDESHTETLAFRHPLAGIQLVKGTIEAGEDPADTALRELEEESGIHGAWIVRSLGVWDSGEEGQVWSFHLCATVQPLADSWVHHASDDGGQDFHFFWHKVEQPPSQEWHPVQAGALRFILNGCSVRNSARASP